MHDVIVAGAGPAGLAAGIYAAGFGLKTLILEASKVAGGRMCMAKSVTNYPGFVKISGPQLADKMMSHATRVGAEIHTAEKITNFAGRHAIWVETNNGVYDSKILILATGAGMKGFGLEGETWIGDGISYCQQCNHPHFEQIDVAVIGSGERAVEEAICISRVASHVHLVVHGKTGVIPDTFRHRLQKKGIEVIEEFRVEAIRGKPPKKQLVLRSLKDRSAKKVLTNIVFVVSPVFPWVSVIRKAGIATHRAGCVAVDEFGRTNIKGIFAAGSCASSAKDIILSCLGDGTTIAAHACLQVRNQF